MVTRLELLTADAKIASTKEKMNQNTSLKRVATLVIS